MVISGGDSKELQTIAEKQTAETTAPENKQEEQNTNVQQQQKSGHKKSTIITAGIIAVILAIVGYVACKMGLDNMVPELDGTFLELMDDTKDGLFDDVLDIEKDGKAGITEITELENCVQILEMLEDIDLEQVGKLNPVTEEEATTLADITVEEVETLIAKLDDEGIMFKQRAEILQKLQHIQRTNKEWLVNEGLTTLESTLIQLIKAKCCEVTGIPAANYNDITIEPIQGDQKITFIASISERETGAFMSTPIKGYIEDWCILCYDIQSFSSQRQEIPTEAEFEEYYIVTKEYIKEGLPLVRAGLYIQPKQTKKAITNGNNYGNVKEYIKTLEKPVTEVQ